MYIILSNKYIFTDVKIDDILQLLQRHKNWYQIVTRLLQIAATNDCKEFILRNIFPAKWNFNLVYLVSYHLGQKIELQRNSENGR